MKKIFNLGIIMLMAIVACVSCKSKDKAPETAPEPPKKEVYTPVHKSTTVDLTKIKTYNYFDAPMRTAASSVAVDYDQNRPYARPITVKYRYSNGDTYTYTVPADFGLWDNEAGRLRVVIDGENTVWLQGQTKKGKFCEFVFYGNPKYNGTKVKPNSYRNLPAGEIKYRK